MLHRLFVYGTLKRGDVRAYLLDGQHDLGEVKTQPIYKLFNTGDYPALVDAEPIGRPGVSIEGELWQVDSDCLARLDVEEGVDEGLYERRAVALMDTAETVQTYFYLHTVDEMPDCGERWL